MTSRRRPPPAIAPRLALALRLAPALGLALACGTAEEEQAEVLPEDELTGMPSESAGDEETLLDACLGSNAPEPAGGSTLGLPGWVRYYMNPHACPDNEARAEECRSFQVPKGRENAPAARVAAIDPAGNSIESFSDTGNGRVTINVPVRSEGFSGHAVATLDGFLDVRFYTSRPVTDDDVSGWVWMVTAEEATSLAERAGTTLHAGRARLFGAVHDCPPNWYGLANAVVTVNGSTDDVVYFDAWEPSLDATFTDASGRFAVADLDPGPVTVKAYGRLEPGGPLVLLSRADVEAVADAVVAVDLQPRVALER